MSSDKAPGVSQLQPSTNTLCMAQIACGLIADLVSWSLFSKFAIVVVLLEGNPNQARLPKSHEVSTSCEQTAQICPHRSAQHLLGTCRNTCLIVSPYKWAE